MKHSLRLVLVLLLAGCPEPRVDCESECAGLQLPAPTCADGFTLVTTSLDAQQCAAGCQTVQRSTLCEFGCAGGACLSPTPTDAGNADAGNADAGNVDAGNVDAGNVDAGSDAGTDPCANVTCLTPPAATCADAQHLEVSDVPGTCDQGLCSYGKHTELCASGCVNGACVNNPCQGVTCVTPPANVCDDATTLRTFAPTGTCGGGTCTYAAQTTPCTFGCAGGSCVNDPCAGVTCVTPPASSCIGSTRRSYASSGTCAAGTCAYAPTDTPCAFGCSNGACNNDPCAGVACTMPPAAACVNASTLRTFASSGTCAAGTCSYAPSDVACAFGCANGACVNDPCAGVSCTQPPAPTCVTTTSLRTYSSPGTCANGACSYTSAVQSCPAAPAPTCADAFTQRTFSAACSNGACGNTSTDTFCPGGCAAGACVPVVCQRAQTRPCSAECFCEENLIDENGLTDLVARASNDIWVCGAQGSLVHYDGTSWVKTPPLTNATLIALKQSTSGALWAVGSSGTVLRNTDGGWEALDAGTTATLRAVDGFDTGLYAVGDLGTVAYFNGTSWSVRDAGAISFTGVAATGSTVVAVGNVNGSTPVAYRLTSTTMTPTTLPANTGALTSVTTYAGNTTAVGFGGTVINYSGSTWSTATLPNAQSTTYLSRIRQGWVLGDRTWSGGGTLWNDRTASVGTASSVSVGSSATYFLSSNQVSSYNGSTLTPLSFGTTINFEGVSAASPNEVWVVGTDGQLRGRVVVWDGTRFTERGVAGTWGNVPLHDVFALASNDVYAVGDDAALLHFDGTNWTALEYAPALFTDWLAVHASSPTNVWLAGYERVRRFNGTSWSTETLTGFQVINDVFTFSSSEGWTVGTTARHRTAAGWTLVSTGTTNQLNAVWGSSPNDVWVGGAGGFLARWNGTSFTTVPSGTTNSITRITGRGPNDVYIGGASFLKHWDGTTLRTVATGFPLTRVVEDIWAGAGGELWLVGGGGVARHKSN